MAAASVSHLDLSAYHDDIATVPYLGDRTHQHFYRENQSSKPYVLDGPSAEELLVRSTRAICSRHNIIYIQLTCLQRKFLTHYRCSNCGLVPLYHINLSHVKRVRCRKCGELTPFTRKGKYGKLRKEVAFELAKEINGGVSNVMW